MTEQIMCASTSRVSARSEHLQGAYLDSSSSRRHLPSEYDRAALNVTNGQPAQAIKSKEKSHAPLECSSFMERCFFGRRSEPGRPPLPALPPRFTSTLCGASIMRRTWTTTCGHNVWNQVVRRKCRARAQGSASGTDR